MNLIKVFKKVYRLSKGSDPSKVICALKGTAFIMQFILFLIIVFCKELWIGKRIILILISQFSVLFLNMLLHYYKKIIVDMLDSYLKGKEDIKRYTNNSDTFVSELYEILSQKVDEQKQDSTKSLEFGMLSYQIDPHFLYNALESIRGKAIFDGNHEIEEMTGVLSFFFRYRLQTKQHVVTLADEMKSVDAYMKIQQFRFGNRFSVEVIYEDCDDSLLRYRVPKLTIQPIVENAIIHGLEDQLSGGYIKIIFLESDFNIIIHIIDNGKGVCEDMLSLINESLLEGKNTSIRGERQSGGIALNNINNRIRLLFGKEYGLHIYSTPNYGTDVEICLPKIEEIEYDTSLNNLGSI